MRRKFEAWELIFKISRSQDLCKQKEGSPYSGMCPSGVFDQKFCHMVNHLHPITNCLYKIWVGLRQKVCHVIMVTEPHGLTEGPAHTLLRGLHVKHSLLNCQKLQAQFLSEHCHSLCFAQSGICREALLVTGLFWFQYLHVLVVPM